MNRGLSECGNFVLFACHHFVCCAMAYITCNMWLSAESLLTGHPMLEVGDS